MPETGSDGRAGLLSEYFGDAGENGGPGETMAREEAMAKRIRKTAYIRCRGGSSLLEGIDRSSLPPDCNSILSLYPDGISKCRYACLGGGTCVAACHFAAISIEGGGPPAVNKEKCVGCGLCMRACPQDIIDIILPENNIQPKCSNRDAGRTARDACADSCIACRICEKNCPAGAIHVTGNLAVIDQERCIMCGMCAVKCPRGVIRDMHGIMTD